ncbi:MAG: hypothetical protein WD076_09985 [Parvularculaceae bacterium]
MIVSSLEAAHKAYAAYAPTRVISLLSGDEAVPQFEGVAPERHLRLYVERESCGQTISAAARERAGEIVEFIRQWKGEGDILIHCNRGVSRSTAAAYIIMCMRAPKEKESALAESLRKAAPYADPCPLLVSYADELLGRDGRMIEAIEDLPAPSPAISAPLLTLQVAA